MPDVNIPLLRKAVEWAEAEARKPAELREWEQRWWRIPVNATGFTRKYRADRSPECGTTYCIAGYICEVIGAEVDQNWGVVAAKALGLSWDPYDDESDRESAVGLFMATNTIEDVRRIAEEIAGERL